MLLTLATFAFAAELREDHPSTYTVVKGDTLWDISAKFLTKPWLWPEIWQANPQVKNPHLIYPGDVLSLVYVNGQPRLTSEPGPEIKYGEAIDTIPLSEIEVWLKQLTIVQDPKSFPYVVGLEGGHLAIPAAHLAFVRGLTGAQPGQTVQIARPVAYYAMGGLKKNGQRTGGMTWLDTQADRDHIHWGYGDVPQEARGEKLGYEMKYRALGEVIQVQGEIASVLVRASDMEVRVGDRILPVEEQPYCNCFTPHAAASIPAGAQILAVDRGLAFAGPRNVVALSIGSSSGVDNGTTYSIWHPGEEVSDIVAHSNVMAQNSDKLTMPDRYVGHLMVFRTFEKVSYALVMDGLRPAEIGDFLKHPDAMQ